ncbi:noncanonical pyrimidine nucleotidase, YjjG family [Anaerolineae bacterium CFX7]|nr:noncanonical pyrimidine nucleotidase, YjjG family [Anaerolineae bacterium CFX7]
MNSQFQWLIFDADDTLFDYAYGERNALETTFREFGLPFDARALELYRDINHQLWLRFEKREITGAQIRAERFTKLFAALAQREPPGLAERFIDHLAEQTTLIQGACELVRTLQCTYRLAVITNGMARVQQPRMAQSLLAPYISELIISDQVGAAKPAPEIFDYAFARMGNPPRERVIIIGDSLTSDMQGGVNYGIATCWYNPAHQPRPPQLPLTYEIHALRELIPLLTTEN